jgi:aspartate-semialdehyde dehydrogenase
VGRIRDDPGGQGVHLWATTDAIAFGVAANVVAVLGALVAEELI